VWQHAWDVSKSSIPAAASVSVVVLNFGFIFEELDAPAAQANVAMEIDTIVANNNWVLFRPKPLNGMFLKQLWRAQAGVKGISTKASESLWRACGNCGNCSQHSKQQQQADAAAAAASASSKLQQQQQQSCKNDSQVNSLNNAVQLHIHYRKSVYLLIPKKG